MKNPLKRPIFHNPTLGGTQPAAVIFTMAQRPGIRPENTEWHGRHGKKRHMEIIRKSEPRFPDNFHVPFSVSSVPFRVFRVEFPGL